MVIATESSLNSAPVDCGDNERKDCPHNQTKTFSIFVTTQLPPKNEIRREDLAKAWNRKSSSPTAGASI